MNLRDIKKDIDYVFSAFIEDCTIVAAVNPKADSDVISGLYEEAVEKYNDLRDKAAVKVEGGIFHRPFQGDLRGSRRPLRQAQRCREEDRRGKVA